MRRRQLVYQCSPSFQFINLQFSHQLLSMDMFEPSTPRKNPCHSSSRSLSITKLHLTILLRQSWGSHSTCLAISVRPFQPSSHPCELWIWLICRTGNSGIRTSLLKRHTRYHHSCVVACHLFPTNRMGTWAVCPNNTISYNQWAAASLWQTGLQGRSRLKLIGNYKRTASRWSRSARFYY